MRPQDFLSGKLKDVKFRISLPDELVTTQEEVDQFAIDFLNWCMSEEAKDLMEDLALIGEINKYVTTEQVLEIFKKEKRL